MRRRRDDIAGSRSIYEQHTKAPLLRSRRPTDLRLVTVCLSQCPERLRVLAIDLTLFYKSAQFTDIAILLGGLKNSSGGEITRQPSIRNVANMKSRLSRFQTCRNVCQQVVAYLPFNSLFCFRCPSRAHVQNHVVAIARQFIVRSTALEKNIDRPDLRKMPLDGNKEVWINDQFLFLRKSQRNPVL